MGSSLCRLKGVVPRMCMSENARALLPCLPWRHATFDRTLAVG